MLVKIRGFLQSKIRTEYPVAMIVPWYKGYWYYRAETNSYICIIMPLNIILVIIKTIWHIIKFFGMDFSFFYSRQIENRKKSKPL